MPYYMVIASTVKRYPEYSLGFIIQEQKSSELESTLTKLAYLDTV
jgi:hypothetical protein